MAGARDFPPLLIFHWEAGADVLLDLDGPVATPFLHQMLSRPDVFAGSAIASVPVTLKTAWEAGACRMAGHGWVWLHGRESHLIALGCDEHTG